MSPADVLAALERKLHDDLHAALEGKDELEASLREVAVDQGDIWSAATAEDWQAHDLREEQVRYCIELLNLLTGLRAGEGRVS